MAISIEQIEGLPDYTPSHHLKMWKAADIEVAAVGYSRAINGRTLTKSNATEISAQIAFWEDRVAAEQAGLNGAGNILVRFGERQ